MRVLWSDRQNCSHNASQKVKRIRRFSDVCVCARIQRSEPKSLFYGAVAGEKSGELREAQGFTISTGRIT